MASDNPLTVVEDFLALYEREAGLGDMAWRSTALSDDLCTRLLEIGFSAETLLLNKRLPISILRTIAKDPDPRVRCMVADKRSASTLLSDLATDPDVSVRMRVAWNAKISRHLLEHLANDSAPEVRNVAKNRLANLGPQKPG